MARFSVPSSSSDDQDSSDSDIAIPMESQTSGLRTHTASDDRRTIFGQSSLNPMLPYVRSGRPIGSNAAKRKSASVEGSQGNEPPSQRSRHSDAMPGRFPSSSPVKSPTPPDPRPSRPTNGRQGSDTTSLTNKADRSQRLPPAGRTFFVPSSTSSSSSEDESRPSRGSLRSERSEIEVGAENRVEAASNAQDTATRRASRTNGQTPAGHTESVGLRDLEGEQVIDRVILQPLQHRTNARTVDALTDILQGHDNIVQLVEHQGFGTANARRVTTWQHADAGTLADLVHRNKRPATLPTHQARGLSESFIWHTLISLLKAVIYLHQGKSDHLDEDEYPGWMPVVHNYIEPNNIFYTEPAPGQEHKHCRLGNFSRCVVLSSTRGPEDDIQWGQQAEAFTLFEKDRQTGYEAPELLDNKHVEYVPGPESDLWSIGAVAITMMTGYNFWDLLREMAFKDHVRTRPKTGALLDDWRTQSTGRRLELLRKVTMKGRIVEALPGNYSVDLRVFTTLMLTLDPLYRGDALSSLEEAVRMFERNRAEGFTEIHEPTLIERATAAIERSRADMRWPRATPRQGPDLFPNP